MGCIADTSMLSKASTDEGASQRGLGIDSPKAKSRGHAVVR